MIIFKIPICEESAPTCAITISAKSAPIRTIIICGESAPSAQSLLHIPALIRHRRRSWRHDGNKSVTGRPVTTVACVECLPVCRCKCRACFAGNCLAHQRNLCFLNALKNAGNVQSILKNVQCSCSVHRLAHLIELIQCQVPIRSTHREPQLSGMKLDRRHVLSQPRRLLFELVKLLLDVLQRIPKGCDNGLQILRLCFISRRRIL